MKFEVNGKMLNDALKTIKPVIDYKSKIPILYTVKVSARNNKIKIAGTNLDGWVAADLPGNVYEEGEACVDFKEFQALIKNQKDNIIITENTIQNGMTVNYQSINVKEFPPEYELFNFKDCNITNKLIDNIKMCLPYVSLEVSRPTFNMVWIDKENYMATDTHKMILIKNNEIQYDRNISIPYYSAELITKIFKKSKVMNCKISDTKISISDDIYTVVVRINTDLTIPNYKNVIPNNIINTLAFDNNKLNDIINKLPTGYKTNKKGKKVAQTTEVCFNMAYEKMTLQTDLVEPFEVECNYLDTKDNLSVILNKDFLKTVLDTFKDDKEIRIEFTGRTSPTLIKNDEILVLVVPVLDKAA